MAVARLAHAAGDRSDALPALVVGMTHRAWQLAMAKKHDRAAERATSPEVRAEHERAAAALRAGEPPGKFRP